MSAKRSHVVEMSEPARLSAEQAAVKPISFAFQPIVDAKTHEILSYEALVRGSADNETAAQIFDQIAPADLNLFDQRCRTTAIDLAVNLKIPCNLNLNILANSRYSPERRIRTTLEAANRGGLPLDCIVLEVSEGQIIHDPPEFAKMVNLYQRMGFKMAIDDFGAGYAGLSLLADFQPNQIKIDRGLIHHIESRGPRQVIVHAVIQVCRDLGIDLVAEGVETKEQYAWLVSEGVRYFQGYLFGRPAFETLETPSYGSILPAPGQPT
jgi:blue light- and temperature-responsive anti-repressor